jgi:hypothetical protein
MEPPTQTTPRPPDPVELAHEAGYGAARDVIAGQDRAVTALQNQVARLRATATMALVFAGVSWIALLIGAVTS